MKWFLFEYPINEPVSEAYRHANQFALRRPKRPRNWWPSDTDHVLLSWSTSSEAQIRRANYIMDQDGKIYKARYGEDVNGTESELAQLRSRLFAAAAELLKEME